MTVLNIKSMKKNRIFNCLFILIVLTLLCKQTECIKFGRRQSAKVPQPQHDKNIETPKVNNDKMANAQNLQNKQKDLKQKQTTHDNPQLAIKQAKTPQIKPQQTSVPTSTVTPQQKSVSPIQQKHAVDSLFGTQEQKVSNKQKQKSVLTITPQKRESQPSTVPEIQHSKQQYQPKQSILGELFGNDLEKIIEIAQKQQEKQNQKEVTAISKPQKSNQNQQTKEVQVKALEKLNPNNNQNQQKQKNVKQESKDKVTLTQKTQKTQKPLKSQTKDESQDSDNDEQQNVKSHKQKDQEQQQQDDDVIYSKKVKKETKKMAEPHQQTESKYSFTLLLTFLLYSFIIVMVIVTIKCTSSSSKASKAVNIMVDAVGDAFKKKQGYRPALNEEQITEREDQITVGYTVDDNKQIFWEKNSVQGI